MSFNPLLAVIYVEYNPEKYIGSFERLRTYLAGLKKKRVVYVVVNNRDEGDGSKAVDERTYYVQGDNVEREFSGWQKGLVFLRKQNIPYDVILFVNEAFEAVIPSFLGSHNVRWIILKAHILRSAIGFIDTAWERIRIVGKSTRVWINTNCFFIPRSLSDKLGTLVSVDSCNIDKYLPEEFPGTGDIFREDAPLNADYKERIVKWLTVRWHSKLVLDQRNWPMFREKAKAIFNEALLSIRIRELGYPILPYSVPAFLFLKTRGIYRKIRKTDLGGRRKSVRTTLFEQATHDDKIS